MRSPRLLIAIVVSLAALLAVGLALVSADESIETPEPVDPAVVILEPGENLVGWLGEPLLVDHLMRQFPTIESVSTWEPLTAEFYEPTSLLAGQGYVVTLSGAESVQWRRPMTPVKGKVTLERGRNLVTWLGPGGWTIDRVAKGIGRALVKAEWGHHQYWKGDSADHFPTVQRGEALWIEVSRRVNWLQPAGVMPTIKFAGEAPADLKSVVRGDSVDVMNHFAKEFSLQPDGSILTVYVAASLDALLDQFELDGRATAGVPKLWYDAGGWANSDGHIVLKLEQWQPDNRTNESGVYGEFKVGRGVMAHEYYHAIQQQLSSTNAAEWLVEGGADWARAGIRRRDAETSVEVELAGWRRTVASSNAPPLDHAERRVENWQYTLGALASHQLALRSGEQSLIEFWRALLPEPLGPLAIQAALADRLR